MEHTVKIVHKGRIIAERSIEAANARDAISRILTTGIRRIDPNTHYSILCEDLRISAHGDEFVRVAEAMTDVDESAVDYVGPWALPSNPGLDALGKNSYVPLSNPCLEEERDEKIQVEVTPGVLSHQVPDWTNIDPSAEYMKSMPIGWHSDPVEVMNDLFEEPNKIRNFKSPGLRLLDYAMQDMLRRVGKNVMNHVIQSRPVKSDRFPGEHFTYNPEEDK